MSRNTRRDFLKVAAATTGGAGLIGAATLSHAMTAGAASGIPAAGTSLLDDIVHRGVLHVGMALQYPPLAYLDTSGKPSGYSVELLQTMAKDLNVKLNYLNVDFASLIPALVSGKVDILYNGHSATPQRELAVEFTDPIIKYNEVLCIQAKSTITALSDLNDPSKTITSQLGTTQEVVSKLLFPKAKQLALSDQQTALLQVATGRADGTILDSFTAVPYVKAHPSQLKIFKNQILYAEVGSAVIRPYDQRFLNYLNAWLRWYNGTDFVPLTYTKWFAPVEGILNPPS